MMRPVLLLSVSLPLLLGGCGEKSVAEVKAVEEKQQEVKPEGPVAETKPAEAVSVSPHLKYETEGDAVTIIGCDKKASGAFTIPATIEGKPVTSIGREAFYQCYSLTSITIPNGVTSIGYATFSHCTSLTSISIPDGVTSIGNSAFEDCHSLTSITIPDSVTSIGKQAFQDCRGLKSVTIGDSVTSIGRSAFWGCISLTAVTFLGDAPKAGDDAVSMIFRNEFIPGKKEATPTIYRNPEAKSWGDTWDGRPVKLISEKP